MGDSTDAELLEVRERLGHDLTPVTADIHEMSAVDGLIYEMEDTSTPAELSGESVYGHSSSNIRDGGYWTYEAPESLPPLRFVPSE